VKRIAELWDSYAEEVLPRSAGAVQRAETRRAFYAGANALFEAFIDGLTEGSEAEEEDMRALDQLREDLAAFKRDVEEGRA